MNDHTRQAPDTKEPRDGGGRTVSDADRQILELA
jgi:hypothetical protein